MAKKKFTRKRQTVLTKKVNIAEAGIVIPEHIRNLKNPRQHFLLQDYTNGIGIILEDLNNLIKLRENETNRPDTQVSINHMNRLLVSSHRSAVIQYFCILDLLINRLLWLRQFDLNISNDSVEYFTEPDVGLRKFLSKQDYTPDFDSLYSKIKHFRTLRNQFSHYPDGIFCLGAEKESFEDFIKKLDGIELNSNGGFHYLSNGKPGMQLLYTTTSDEYVHTLFKTGTDFFKALLNIFCPDVKEKD